MDRHKSCFSVDPNKCTPCSGLTCVGVCPQGILELGENKKPQLIDEASCTKCGICANLCPNKAITIMGNKSTQNK